MTQRNKELLTIGDIAKATGVHPKSIRYYERIGILEPASIDPETGYRYYAPAQIHYLFAIKTCIHLGIPLRDFPKYYKSGTIYTSQYLQDAALISTQKIRSLERNLEFIKSMESCIIQSDQLITAKCVLNMEQPERTFLIREISQDLTFHDLLHVYSVLKAAANQPFIHTELFMGKIAVFQQDQLEHLYAAVPTSMAANDCQTLTLPAAPYASLYSKHSAILQAPRLFTEQASAGNKLMVFESSCISSNFQAALPGYILQCINL